MLLSSTVISCIFARRGSGTMFFLFQTRVASFFYSFSFFSSASRVWNGVFSLSDPKTTILRVWENVFPLPDPGGFLFLFFFLLFVRFSGLERRFFSLRPENHNISGLGGHFFSSRPGWLPFSLLFSSFRPLLGSGKTFSLSQTRKPQYFGSGRTFFFFQPRTEKTLYHSPPF